MHDWWDKDDKTGHDMFAKSTCKSMHLDTMEAQTASLQARAGGGLRVMRRRRVGASRRRREASLHLETTRVYSRKWVLGTWLLTSCCDECQRSCEQLFSAGLVLSSSTCPPEICPPARATPKKPLLKTNPPRNDCLSFFVEIFETRKSCNKSKCLQTSWKFSVLQRKDKKMYLVVA